MAVLEQLCILGFKLNIRSRIEVFSCKKGLGGE